MLSMVEDEDDDSHINPSEDPASNFVSMGSVLDMKGAGSSLAKSISFDEKKPAYPQVMSLFNDVVTEVGGNPVLLRNLFNRLKDHVAIPLLTQVQQLNDAGENCSAGGLRPFSRVNDAEPQKNKRLQAGYELALQPKKKK